MFQCRGGRQAGHDTLDVLGRRRLAFRPLDAILVLLALIPTLFVLIPGLRLIPAIYRWQIRLRIYRSYRALLAVEREAFSNTTAQDREELLTRLAHIEKTANKLKVPASFADQFYVLRQNIIFVRNKLAASSQAH